MSPACIIAADRELDGCRDSYGYEIAEAALLKHGLRPRILTIDALCTGWDRPVEPDHFRSGCAPVQAVARARELIGDRAAEAVVIRGDEPLKSGYARRERHRLMAIYGDDCSLPEAYTELARAFIARHGIAEEEFRHIAGLLFENYERTFRRTHAQIPLDETWFEPLTELFRGVDCANPLVDFSGRLLLCSADAARRVGIAGHRLVQIAGVGLGFSEDGRANVERIAAYDHLQEAYRRACRQARVDFASRYRAGKALLEAYTCYPVVPMAFLIASGIARSLQHIPAILRDHDVTVTGGMNLARAPWNNPALNALIVMFGLILEQLTFFYSP